jgi:phospholipase/carboxylesterase
MSGDAVEVATHARPTGSVIWLHGLGADGHDFEPVVPELMRHRPLALRFVFPHAPVRAVTLNGGYPMRAWYDILGLDRQSSQDEAGIRASDAAIRALVSRETQRGIASERIVLAGFSQGGAMALYSGVRFPERLAGVMGLSCYLPLAANLVAERSAVNQHTAFFLAHGSHDEVLRPALGEHARDALKAAGYAVSWHSYPMAHSVCAEEIADIAAFLGSVFEAPTAPTG